MRGRLPHRRKFLGRETLDAGVRKDARKGRWKSETVWQHVFVAGDAEFFSKPVVAIKNLAND